MAFLDSTGLSHFLDKLKTLFAAKSDTELDTTLSRGRAANKTVGTASFAFGNNVEASGDYSHAEGNGSRATDTATHAEGFAYAFGGYSHAEGYDSAAYGNFSHVEGRSNTIKSAGIASHAEGKNNVISGEYSHAEGEDNIVSGNHSHVDGYKNIVCANDAYAQGEGLISNLEGMHAFGKYNLPSYVSGTVSDSWAAETSYKAGDMVLHNSIRYVALKDNVADSENEPGVDSTTWYAFTGETRTDLIEVVGNGSSSERKNMRALDDSGNEYLRGNLYIRCSGSGGGLTGGFKVATETVATTLSLGLVQLGFTSVPASRQYAVSAASNKLYTTVDIATNSSYGVVKTGYISSGNNYAVKISSGNLYTTVGAATSSNYGTVKIGFTKTGNKYPVQLSNGQMYVEVASTTPTTTAFSTTKSEYAVNATSGFYNGKLATLQVQTGVTNSSGTGWVELCTIDATYKPKIGTIYFLLQTITGTTYLAKIASGVLSVKDLPNNITVYGEPVYLMT